MKGTTGSSNKQNVFLIFFFRNPSSSSYPSLIYQQCDRYPTIIEKHTKGGSDWFECLFDQGKCVSFDFMPNIPA